MPSIEKEIWPIDGKDHRDVNYKNLYQNQKIDKFFTSDRTILIAAKGMGKTLLLRSKKYLLENSEDGHIIIPKNLEADYPQLMGDFPKQGLESETLWRDLWMICIIFSVMSYRFNSTVQTLQDEPLWEFIDAMDIQPSIKEKIVDDLMSEASNPPSYYLSMFLSIGLGFLQKFIKSAFHVDGVSRHYIHSSTCVFIDAFDQALTERFPDNLIVWKNAQIGLIHAAYRLKCSNHHLKVYVSIRQEAWSAFKSDDRQAIKGMSVILIYDKRSLKQLFVHGIKKYTKYDDIEEFAGINSINNGWCGQQEDIFDYIHRHCVGSPRSIMSIGSDLNDADLKELNEDERYKRFREIVNDSCAEQLYKDYLISQRRIFLDTLDSEDDIKLLLKLLPSNVLRGKTLKTINLKFAYEKGIDEKHAHPFCELFNTGIIGVVKRNDVTNEYEQVFKQPHQFDWKQYELLHSDRIYIVHPSLHKKITDLREKPYYLNPINIIGDGYQWNESTKYKVFPKIFISYSSDDKAYVEKLRSEIEKELDLLYPCDFWVDKEEIKAGANIHSGVEKGIEECDLVLVFISNKSLSSGWVEREWRDKHCEEINCGNVKVICCFIDETPIDQLPRSLSNKKAIFLTINGHVRVGNEIVRMVNDIADILAHARSKGGSGLKL